MSLRHPPFDRSQSDGPSFAGDARHNIANLVNLRLETGAEQHRNSRLRNYFLGYREFMEAPPSPSPSLSSEDEEFPKSSPFKRAEKLNKRSMSSTTFRRPPQRRAVRNTAGGGRGESLSPVSPDNEMFLSSRTYGMFPFLPIYFQSLSRGPSRSLSSNHQPQTCYFPIASS